MNTRLASAFGLAMLAETSHTAASVVESVVSESGMNVTPLAEANVPEAQVGEVAATSSVVSAPPIEATAPPAVPLAETIPAEITETVTVVVPGQKSEDDEGAAIPASGIAGIEPSLTEASPQTAVPEGEAKANAELSAQTDAAQIEVAGPAAVVAAVKPPSTDVNTPPAVLSADAVPVEITVTMTIVVPGQTSEDDEGAAIPASGIAGIEPSLTEEPSQTAAPGNEAKATAEVAEQIGTAEVRIVVADPAAVAAIEPPSSDVNAPPAIVSVDAVAVEITETVTVVVPGQKSEDIDDAGSEPEHPAAAPNLKRDKATAALDDGE
jgi:hypothetical protein